MARAQSPPKVAANARKQKGYLQPQSRSDTWTYCVFGRKYPRWNHGASADSIASKALSFGECGHRDCDGRLGLDRAASDSGDRRVLASPDVRTELNAPTLRIRQEPQELLVPAFVFEAHLCRFNARDDNVRNSPAGGHAHAEAKRRITANSEGCYRQEFEQGLPLLTGVETRMEWGALILRPLGSATG